MDSSILSYLLIALVALGIVAVIVLIRTLGRLGQTAEALTGAAGALADTARSATATSDEARTAVVDIRERIAPTLIKVDVAVDAVNANLLRLDSIMGDIEATTEQVANASTSISNLASAPVDVVTGLADRFRKAWRVRKAEVTEDVHRYSESLSHAAQQASHVEYAPAGTAYAASHAAPAPSPAPVAPSAPVAAPAAAPEPEPAPVVVPEVEPTPVPAPVAETPVAEPQFAPAPAVETEPDQSYVDAGVAAPVEFVEFIEVYEVAEYVEPVESASTESAEPVETHYEVPAEPDVDDSDADFSSEDISRFSAAAVLGHSSAEGAGGAAGGSMSDHLAHAEAEASDSRVPTASDEGVSS